MGQKIVTLSDTKNSNNYLKNIATFNLTDELVLNDGLLWDVRDAKVIHKFDKFNNYVSGVFHPSDLEIIINSEIVSFCSIFIFIFLKSEKFSFVFKLELSDWLFPRFLSHQNRFLRFSRQSYQRSEFKETNTKVSNIFKQNGEKAFYRN